MDDIAIGRKEIMKALHVQDWGTVLEWRKKYSLPIRHTPSRKPMLILPEFLKWVVKYDELAKKSAFPSKNPPIRQL